MGAGLARPLDFGVLAAVALEALVGLFKPLAALVGARGGAGLASLDSADGSELALPFDLAGFFNEDGALRPLGIAMVSGASKMAHHLIRIERFLTIGPNHCSS